MFSWKAWMRRFSVAQATCASGCWERTGGRGLHRHFERKSFKQKDEIQVNFDEDFMKVIENSLIFWKEIAWIAWFCLRFASEFLLRPSRTSSRPAPQWTTWRRPSLRCAPWKKWACRAMPGAKSFEKSFKNSSFQWIYHEFIICYSYFIIFYHKIFM